MNMNHSHLIGHRGARAEAPENTLGGFTYLRELGIQKVELDVHLSQDNTIVVIHDYDTLRTTGENFNVRTTPSQTLAELDASARFAGDWHYDEPVPTLMNVLSDWPLLEHIQIEVKTLASQADRKIMAEGLQTILVKLKLDRETTVITSSDWDFLEISLQVNAVPHGVVVENEPERSLIRAQKIGCRLFVLDYRLYSEEIAQICAEAKMPVSLWTVNDAETADILTLRGATTIITDKPGAFVDFIKAKSTGQTA